MGFTVLMSPNEGETAVRGCRLTYRHGPIDTACLVVSPSQPDLHEESLRQSNDKNLVKYSCLSVVYSASQLSIFILHVKDRVS